MHQFNADPLPMVWLLNGFFKSEQAGRSLVRYDHLFGLVSALHEAVVLKPALLTGPEITYLRRALDVRQADVANVLGCSEQTLSLWERGSHPITRAADTLVRKYFVEKSRSIGPKVRRSCSIEKLSSLSRATASLMYEGSFSAGRWGFGYGVVPAFQTSEQIVVQTAVPWNSVGATALTTTATSTSDDKLSTQPQWSAPSPVILTAPTTFAAVAYG